MTHYGSVCVCVKKSVNVNSKLKNTWQPCRRSLAKKVERKGRVGSRKELKHGDAAMDEQHFGYRIGCQTQKGRGMGRADIVDIVEHAHDRDRSQTDPEAMHDLKCQTRFGCVTFEVGQRQNSNGKRKMENRSEEPKNRRTFGILLKFSYK